MKMILPNGLKPYGRIIRYFIRSLSARNVR